MPRRISRSPAATAAMILIAGVLTGLVGCRACEAVAGQTAEAAPEATPETIAELISRLGDADYQRRESAAAALKAIGPAAVDSLLAAAELDGDLEIALRARWLVDTIPLAMPQDVPEVARLLESYQRRDYGERLRVMHRLLRVDDDAGIEALARIVRLERSPAGSRVAAALLVREWREGDRWWPGIAARTVVGLGASQRPAAGFLRALIEFSSTTAADDRNRALAAADAAFEALARSPVDEPPAAAGDDDDELADRDGGTVAQTMRIFERCRVSMLLASGRRDEAVAEATRLLEASWTGLPAKQAASRSLETLVWATELGLPEIVGRLLALRPDLIADDALLAYAAASAERRRGDEARATELADAAFARQHAPVPGRRTIERMQAAMLLARWGAADWAVRAYTAILDDPQTPVGEYALSAILAGEYLHEMDRDVEAAACLGRLFEPGAGRRDFNAEQVLVQLGRDHRATQARMQFFASCAAAARGDVPERRRLLESALRSLGKDIDSLIALYHLPDNTADQRGDAVRRINEALRQIDNEIQGMPDEPNGYNEYAWLVANTLGDVDKATRYSKQSLVKSFDNSSYLDTLAHCRAAAGDLEGAVRWQSLARRQEPHNQTIRRNLERFEAMAAAAAKP